MLVKEAGNGEDLKGIREWCREMVDAVGVLEGSTKWESISQKEE